MRRYSPAKAGGSATMTTNAGIKLEMFIILIKIKTKTVTNTIAYYYNRGILHNNKYIS